MAEGNILAFLGLGQRVTMDFSNPNEVKEIICDMKNKFKCPSKGPLPLDVRYDQDSKWLIGMELNPVSFINLKAIFHDPRLYGLRIGLEGEEAGIFNKFSLDVLYEKINDSIGAYKGRITIPDNLRRLEFGAVTVILPEFYIELYTNGDFKVDVGFPTNLDFSRSMTIEAFPYLGSGGFYIGKLSQSTTTHEMPDTNGRGNFGNITQFGIGMQLGIGKSIEKGVLKAGLSLTILGVLEGVLANFISDEGRPDVSHDRYHWLQGTVGIAGKLYGEVDFEIVAARVEALIQAVAQMTLEAHKPTPIIARAKVSAHAEVKLKLGPIKAKKSMSFNEEIQTDFHIGSRSRAEWEETQLGLITDNRSPLKWQPIIMGFEEFKKTLNIYFIPHVSIADEESFSGWRRELKYASMLYIKSEDVSIENNPFKLWSEAVLLWTINAYINRKCDEKVTLNKLLKEEITGKMLQTIKWHLTGACGIHQTSIDYENEKNKDILTFLNEYFNINICLPNMEEGDNTEDQELSLSYFPMFPHLKLQVKHSREGSDDLVLNDIIFREGNKGKLYSVEELGYIKDYLRQTSVNYQNRAESHEDNIYNKKRKRAKDESMALVQWQFQDCILMMARALIDEAIGFIGNCVMTVGELIQIPSNPGNAGVYFFTRERLSRVAAMITRYMMHGMQIPMPEVTAYDRSTPTYPIYELSGQQFTVPDVKSGDVIKFELNKVKGLDLKFKKIQDESEEGEDSLQFEIPSKEIDRMISLKSTSTKLDHSDLGKIYPLKTFREVNTTYTFADPITWSRENAAGQTEYKIWPFSELMNKALETASHEDIFQLMKTTEDGLCTKIETDNTGDACIGYATMINIDIRRIQKGETDSNTMSAQYWPNIYDVIGADEKGRLYLERLVAEELQNVFIYILAPQLKAGNLSDLKNQAARLVKTNLSIETNPSSFTNEENGKNFVRNLLHSSLVRSGGFYLYYCVNGEGLDRLFEDNKNTVRISIIIKYNDCDGAPLPTKPTRLTNVVVLEKNQVGKTETLFFEQVNKKTIMPAYPAGHIGFEILREDETVLLDEEEDKTYIKEQFNLVAYKLLKNRNLFEDQPISALPVGQTSKIAPNIYKDFEPQQEEYSYQVVTPVAKFVKSNFRMQSNNCKASTGWDPYAGIGQKVDVEVYFQDSFGNRLINPTVRTSKPIPILYRDFLVPIHQLPGMKVEYEVIRDFTGPILKIMFTFDKSKFDDAISPEKIFGELNNCEDNNTDVEIPDSSKDNIKQHNNALVARDTYCLLYNQLKQSDTIISCRTSLMGDKENPEGAWLDGLDKEDLLNYVGKIMDYLECKIKGESDECTDIGMLAYTKHAPMTNTKNIFELSAQFGIHRTKPELIDWKFREISAVSQAVSTVWPKLIKEHPERVREEDPDPALRTFAESFEQLYGNKIAVGTSRTTSNQGENKKIWVVNIHPSEGWKINISRKAFYYAPPPLSTDKWSGKFLIEPYCKHNESKKIEKSFDAIDLDLWAKNCLTYIDVLLSPQYAVPVYLIDDGVSLNQILEAKRKIAKAVAGTVTHIGKLKSPGIVSDSHALEDAKYKLEQQMLVRLSNAYDIDCIVQHPVEPVQKHNKEGITIEKTPRLFGSVMGTHYAAYRFDDPRGNGDTEQRGYTLSNTKLVLSEEQAWLTYLFSTKQDGKFQRYAMKDMHYHVSHIEHQIEDISAGGYEASSWLSFVIPFKVEVGNDGTPSRKPLVNIPVPYRMYPTPPKLEGHEWVYEPAEVFPIKETRYWEYRYTYTNMHSFEAQDRVKSKIQFNVKKSEGLLRSIDELGRSLAQLEYTYKDIKEHLDSLLDINTLHSSCQTIDISKPITKFIQYVKDLSEQWKAWQISLQREAAHSEQTLFIEYEFDILEAPQKEGDEGSPLCIHVIPKHNMVEENGEDSIQTPYITINGYETEVYKTYIYRFFKCDDIEHEEGEPCSKKNYLAYNKRKDEQFRTVSVRHLDVLNFQHAWAGVYLTRNEGLFEGIENESAYDSTNELFIYRTPLVKFENQITPLLVNEQFIDIASMDGQRRVKSIYDHLECMFYELLRDRVSENHVIKGKISYTFDIYKEELIERRITVPCFAINPFKYPENKEFLKEMGDKMLHLFDLPGGPNKSVGGFNIQLGVYEAVEDERPILQLKELFLDLNQISELQE